jgi:cell division protein FtsQ
MPGACCLQALDAVFDLGVLAVVGFECRDVLAVEHVRIGGVRGADALEIRQALDAAARRMTTMDFNVAALRAAAAPFVVVSGVRATTSFPHTVRIEVSERLPVAALTSGGQRTAVAQDGTVLGAALLSSSLPVVTGASQPTPGARVGEAGVLADLAVLGAAPAQLTRFVARVFNGREGITVAMGNGLLVYFGNATRPHAKWLSLARVLAAPSSAGAWYVDVRLPERPAAGASGASTSTPVQAGASDPTAAALAARLATAVGGGSGASMSPSAASGESSSEAAPGGSGESPGASGTEASGTSAGSGEAPRSSAPEAPSSAAGAGSAAVPASPSTSAPGASSEAVGSQGGSSATPATGG